MTAVEEDVDVVELLDFEESKACEWDPPGCEREAQFLVLHNCCGYSYLACAPHVEELREYFRWVARHGIGAKVVCTECGKSGVSCPSLIPLGGA